MISSNSPFTFLAQISIPNCTINFIRPRGSNIRPRTGVIYICVRAILDTVFRINQSTSSDELVNVCSMGQTWSFCYTRVGCVSTKAHRIRNFRTAAATMPLFITSSESMEHAKELRSILPQVSPYNAKSKHVFRYSVNRKHVRSTKRSPFVAAHKVLVSSIVELKFPAVDVQYVPFDHSLVRLPHMQTGHWIACTNR